MAEDKTGRRKSSKMKIVEVPSVDAYGHKQPQNLEMECAVLGALMVDQDAYSQVSELLKPESFYDHRHQLIYQAVQSLSAEQKPVDIMTIIDKLESLDTLEEAGGPSYVMQINSQISSSTMPRLWPRSTWPVSSSPSAAGFRPQPSTAQLMWLI